MEKFLNLNEKQELPVTPETTATTRASKAFLPFSDLDFAMINILLIEDNEFIRDNTLHMLMFANFNVSVVPNGKAGLEMARLQKFDLVICDIMMPELDGFGVLEALKKDPATASIPFIFLTPRTSSEIIRKAFDMGADDYLLKPFHEQELMVAVESCLQKKGPARSGKKKTTPEVGLA